MKMKMKVKVKVKVKSESHLPLNLLMAPVLKKLLVLLQARLFHRLLLAQTLCQTPLDGLVLLIQSALP